MADKSSQIMTRLAAERVLQEKCCTASQRLESPAPQPELPRERMCQAEQCNDISNSNCTARQANTQPIQLQICCSPVRLYPSACASKGGLAATECTSGVFLKLLCLSLPFPPPSPLSYLAKGFLVMVWIVSFCCRQWGPVMLGAEHLSIPGV